MTQDVRVERKDGRVFYGPLYEIRSAEGWFSLSIDDADVPEASAGPATFFFADCVSVVNRRVQTAYNKIEDVDLIAWAAKDVLERAKLDAKAEENVKHRDYKQIDDHPLSPEEEAAFEAAVAQADSEHAPAVGSIVWQMEVDLVLAMITHPAGYDVGLCPEVKSLAVYSIYDRTDGLCAVHEQVDFIAAEDPLPEPIVKLFTIPREAAEYFVTRRYALKLGLDFERPKGARRPVSTTMDVLFVCDGHMCGNIAYAAGNCGCCSSGTLVRYVRAP